MLGGSPCHHSMARPRVADGRDSLQQWRLATRQTFLALSKGPNKVGASLSSPEEGNIQSLRVALSIGPNRCLPSLLRTAY
jgi:hypothetical protein